LVTVKKVDNTETKKIEQKIRTLIDGDRIINFSDAVFAFAATLLVLKIDLPQIPPELLSSNFTGELLKLWPAYAANFVSFLIIAYYWRVHHKLFILIKRYDNVVIWLNILILIFVSFMPFPIDLFGNYPTVIPVVIFYTLSISIVGLLLLGLWIYASVNHRLVDKNLSAKAITYHTLSNVIAPSVFLLSIPLIMIDHVLAKFSWLMVIVLLLVLNALFKFHHTEQNDPSPE
jgi:uncharacterized membrane protein